MVSLRNLQAEEKNAQRQRRLLAELDALARDVERSERNIAAIQRELGEANQKHTGPRTTREDVSYLSALLSCAKKKLAWEKQIASLQKRTVGNLEQLNEILNDPLAPPSEAARSEMLAGLTKIQAALDRLQGATEK